MIGASVPLSRRRVRPSLLLWLLLLCAVLSGDALAKKKKTPPPEPPAPVVEAQPAPPPPPPPPIPVEPTPSPNLKLEQLLSVKNLPKADAQSRGERSRVIYPDQTIPLRFSHKNHLAKDIACDSCHQAALTSTSARDRLLPTEEDCAVCHPIDRANPYKKTDAAPATCATCHVGVPSEPGPETPAAGKDFESLIARIVIPDPNLKFNHKQHLDKQVPCATCHGDLSKVDLATRAQLPTMAQCLSCHDGLMVPGKSPRPAEASPAPTDSSQKPEPKSAMLSGRTPRGPSPRCNTCHLQQSDGLLATRFPTGVLAPSGTLRGDVHGMDWKRNHRQPALNDPEYCGACHNQSWCQSCHNGVVRPLDLHGGDYISRHPIEARRNQPDCGSCHRRQTFCLGCHERLGVVSHSSLPGSPPIGSFFPGSSRRFHPEGWASPIAGASHHSWEAQRNLRTCTSCHREETCIDCHSSLPGGRFSIGKNPHGPDWLSSGRCQSIQSRNARVCLKCHRDGSAQMSCLN